jgi:hypothetical protein
VPAVCVQPPCEPDHRGRVGVESGGVGDRGGRCGIGVAPELLFRAAARSMVTGAAGDLDVSLVDDEDARAHEHRVDLPQRRREQMDTHHNQGVGADAASEIGHASRQTHSGDISGSHN